MEANQMAALEAHINGMDREITEIVEALELAVKVAKQQQEKIESLDRITACLEQFVQSQQAVNNAMNATITAISSAAGHVTTRDGLLYLNGRMIPLPEADGLAKNCGFQHAEQLVAALKQPKGL